MDEAGALDALWYDGRQAEGLAVRVRRDGPRLQLDDGHGGLHEVELHRVQWPERTRHGQRVAHLPGGGSLVFAEAAAFDAWRQATGHRESWVVRAQQHWRATFTAVLALVVLVAGGYVWGVPWAAGRIVAAMPAEADAAIGNFALDQLREGLVAPTKSAPEVQTRWRERLAEALAAAYPDPADRTPWTLHVVGGGRLGANAVALPGGHILITDELLALLDGADDAVLGVLAHEYGHVRRQHGLNALVRLGLVSAATSVALGDFSTVLAGVPALLAHLGYSRDAEREADADAALVLRAAGRSPEAMVTLFERMAAKQKEKKGEDRTGGSLPIAFASHPADAERIAFFREAARGLR